MATVNSTKPSTNSVSGNAYTSDQLVLYADLAVPAHLESAVSQNNITATLKIDYTATTTTSNQTY